VSHTHPQAQSHHVGHREPLATNPKSATPPPHRASITHAQVRAQVLDITVKRWIGTLKAANIKPRDRKPITAELMDLLLEEYKDEKKGADGGEQLWIMGWTLVTAACVVDLESNPKRFGLHNFMPVTSVDFAGMRKATGVMVNRTVKTADGSLQLVSCSCFFSAESRQAMRAHCTAEEKYLGGSNGPLGCKGTPLTTPLPSSTLPPLPSPPTAPLVQPSNHDPRDTPPFASDQVPWCSSTEGRQWRSS